MKKGNLIVFEGIDGAGKATQVKMLARTLRARGKKVTTFSFPDYSKPVGIFIHEALHNKHGDFRKLNGYFSTLPYTVDRVLARKNIADALKKGDVICDRYTTSGLAFGAASCKKSERTKFRKFFEDLEYKKFKLPRPDVVLYLELPVVISQKWLRSERGKKLDVNERDVRYQKDVAKEYSVLSKRREWEKIPCTAGEPPAVISQRVWDAVRKA